VIERCQSHGLREPPCWVDGQYDDMAAALGRPQPDGGRDGGLANAARATADDDPGSPVVYELGDHERDRVRAHRTPFTRRPGPAGPGVAGTALPDRSRR